MRRVIIKTIENFNKICSFFREKDKWGTQRSATVIMVTFLVCGVICYFGNEEIKRIAVFNFLLILVGLFILFNLDTEDKLIKRISRKKYKTPREFLKELSHISYLYGLLSFTMEMCIFIEIIIVSLAEIILGKFIMANIIILWIVLMFVYTFIYFLYHIFHSTKEKIENIQMRIQLYTAIGTTISFLMLLLGENQIFKVFISGTMLEFTWLQYIIAKEKNEIYENPRKI